MSENRPTSPKKQQGINSVEVGMDIVKALTRQGVPMSLGDIAASTGMQPAKAHRYLVSLIRTGMVQRYEHSGGYELGPFALEFSLACMAKLESLRIDPSVLKSLATETGESVFTAVWSANGPMVVDWQTSNQPIAASTQIGTVFPVLMSSTGRVYGAYLPDAITSSLIDRELIELADSDNAQGPRSRQAVEKLFAEVRTRGLGRGIGIRLPGISSFSAPVFDHRGRIVSAITAFGYNESFDSSWDGPIAQALGTAASTLSQQRGFLPDAHK